MGEVLTVAFLGKILEGAYGVPERCTPRPGRGAIVGDPARPPWVLGCSIMECRAAAAVFYMKSRQ